VANTDFEGGENDNGYGDYIFLVKHGQPSHVKTPNPKWPLARVASWQKNAPIDMN
jgi:hypothetical protein